MLCDEHSVKVRCHKSHGSMFEKKGMQQQPIPDGQVEDKVTAQNKLMKEMSDE
jgi:hypothetical protein